MTTPIKTVLRKRVSLRRLLWVGPLAIAAAVAANLLMRLIVVRLPGVEPAHPVIQWGPVIGFSAFGILGATLLYALLVRLARRPIRLFLVISFVVWLLSLSTPLLAFTGAISAGGVPVTWPLFLSLEAMHTVAAVVGVGILVTLSRE